MRIRMSMRTAERDAHLQVSEKEIVYRVEDDGKNNGPTDRHKEGPEYEIGHVSKQ